MTIQSRIRRLVVALLALAACAKPAGPPTIRPNVLLIVADDLGYADLGAYGNQRIATPNLDDLARQGMRFTSFYANGPICTPTRVSLLTGRYPQRFGVYGGLPADSTWGLLADAPTLPQLLRQAGYETAHVGKWHLGHTRESYRPLARGFGAFYGFLHAHDLPKTYHDPQLRRDDGPAQVRPGHLTDLLTAEAEDFLLRQKDSSTPFLLNLWYFNPHKPLEPPARWAARYDETVSGRFAALVSTLDENVGRLLAVLDETGLASNTLVVFTSDNGGAREVHRGRNGPLRGGKNQLREGGIRVPLIVRWPGRVSAGTVSDSLAASFDLLPTIADLAEIDLESAPIDGRSLSTVLAGVPDDFEGPLFWEDVHNGQRRFAVRRGRFKLHSVEGHTTLYDLEEDLEEAIDLSADHAVTAELAAAHQDWRTRMVQDPGRANVEPR